MNRFAKLVTNIVPLAIPLAISQAIKRHDNKISTETSKAEIKKLSDVGNRLGKDWITEGFGNEDDDKMKTVISNPTAYQVSSTDLSKER